MPIVEVNPFSYDIKEVAKTNPAVITRLMSRPENINIGYIKTSRIELIILKKKSEQISFDFYTIKGERITNLSVKPGNTHKFYVMDDENIIFDTQEDLSTVFYSTGKGPGTVQTFFNTNVFGIYKLHEYESVLYYNNVVIDSYRTYIVFHDNRFYRICYNKFKFIIFTHDIVRYNNLNDICATAEIKVEEELQYLFSDLTEAKFTELIKFIKTDKFSDLEDALAYVKLITKMEVIDVNKNKIPIDTINNIVAHGDIEKEKLKVFAKMFV